MNHLGCSTSRSKADKSNAALLTTDDSVFQYEIFSSSSTHDCNGREIHDYTPNIGIDSVTGRLVSFEKLSRRNFCDATFLVMIHKDDLSILGLAFIHFTSFLKLNYFQISIIVFKSAS